MLKIWYIGQSWIGCRVCLQSALYSTCTFVRVETVEEEDLRVDEGMELVGKVSSVHIRDGDGYYRYSGSCAVRTHSLQPTTLTKDTLLVISYSNRAPYSEQEQHYHTHRLQHIQYTTAKPQTHNLIWEVALMLKLHHCTCL